MKPEMEITYRNDGKGRHTSWEAEIDADISPHDGYGSIRLTVFGDSEEDVRQLMTTAIADVVRCLQSLTPTED
jgi:hypothetical protein